jgi:hypothetical protein
MSDNQTPSSEQPAEIVPSSNKKVEVSADVLNEAVMQLRKLTELRQRESERQERAIAQMHTALKRQGILSRYVIVCCLIVVVIAAGLAYLMRQSTRHELVTSANLTLVDQRLAETSQTIAEETQKQVSTLDSVRSEVMTTREEQARLTQGVEQELMATRQSHSAVIQKVEEQLGAVRAERDEVRGEVRTVLEEKTRQLTDKEIELRAEREAIKEAKIRSKEEQKALIQQTIERLNAMTASLAVDETAEAPAAPEATAEPVAPETTEPAETPATDAPAIETAPAPTDADIDAVIEQADAVEAAINAEPAAEAGQE